jgi:hypothetical protein
MPIDGKMKYILPQGDEFLRAATANILANIRKGVPAELMLTPLVTRAYTLVNEVGMIPVKDYADSSKLIV